MKSVYCAVRTGSLNKAVCASYLKGQCFNYQINMQSLNMTYRTEMIKIDISVNIMRTVLYDKDMKPEYVVVIVTSSFNSHVNSYVDDSWLVTLST